MLAAALRDLYREAKSLLLDNSLDPMPMRDDLERYSSRRFRADLRAGINVALLAFPQGMAYSVIAGLPIYYGITCSAVATIVAPLLMGSRHTVVGPTNATAFMIFSFFASYPSLLAMQVELMPLLVFLVGLILVVGAYLRLADLIQYISRSVVVGYITGAAVLIIANQFRHILGIDFAASAEHEAVSPRSFFSVVYETVVRLPEMEWQPFAMAGATFVLYEALRRKLRGWPVFALALIIMSGAAAMLARYAGWDLSAYPSFEARDLLPDISAFAKSETLSRIPQIFGIAFAVAFLASLENSVMSKTIASMTGDRARLNQDMLGLGVANLCCSVLSGMPASGSPTRSALNFASGATSRLSSMISGLLCVAGALTLAPAIKFVPKSCLAALVVCIAASLINRRNIRICLRATRSDALTLMASFAATLLMPLHVAIFFGVAISIALYLRKASRPQLVEYEFNNEGQLTEAEKASERRIPSISIVHVEGELFFGAAELFRTQIQRTCNDPRLRVIILRMRNARHLDATSVMALEELIRFLRSKERHLIVSGVTKDVYRVLKNSDLIDVLGRDNIFVYSPANPNIATRNALKRAQELLGTKEAEVKIYYDPSKDSGA